MKIFELSIFWIHIAPTYYGLMYALGFMWGYWIIKKRLLSIRTTSLIAEKNELSQSWVENLFFYIFWGVILWWRLGYVLFYNFSFYFAHPIDIFKIWQGGMSFHGGMIGVVLSLFLFYHHYKVNFLRLCDEIAAVVPIGLWFWRIGNYMNQELLWFAPYHGWLAVYKWGVWYFPSPLVEALLEWMILFFILNYMYLRKTFHGQIGALFLIFYWIFRMGVEWFLRIPDNQIGYLLGHFSLWFLLSFPMLIIGIYLYIYAQKKQTPA